MEGVVSDWTSAASSRLLFCGSTSCRCEAAPESQRMGDFPIGLEGSKLPASTAGPAGARTIRGKEEHATKQLWSVTHKKPHSQYDQAEQQGVKIPERTDNPFKENAKRVNPLELETPVSDWKH